MSYSDVETSLGIKNFRREYMGLVQASSVILPIDPTLEPLTDPKTFNTRFKRLGDAMRQCFSAAGDIAIRDKRYLETFLTGYANPIITVKQSYPDPYLYQNIPNFNTNGTPITFPENRVVYNVAGSSDLNFAAIYHWVFKNGILMNISDYSILNTAYGVKCFIKASLISANDKISIVINRIFNTSTAATTKSIGVGATNTTLIVPVSTLGTFYHHKYIKLFVKRGNDPKRSFIEIPRVNYSTEIDTTGGSIKVDIRNYQLNAGEVVHIMNAVYWWKYEAEGNTGLNFVNEVELSEKQADNVTYRPVPFLSVHDFDVFFNGRHLRAGKHYTIIKGGNEFSPFKIKLLFNPAPNEAYSLRIYKNEAVAEDKDFVYLNEDNIDDKGLVVAPDVTTLPLMSRLGHCFLADRHVSNEDLENKHRRMLIVKNATTRSSFEYRLRIVSSLDIENVLNFANSNLSEFDMVAEWFGMDEIKTRLKVTLPLIVVDPNIFNFENTFVGSGWEHYDVLTAAVEQFRVIADAYLNDSLARTLIIDTNIFNLPDYPMNIVGNMMLLDSNMLQSNVMVLDSNVFFAP